jgi:hypothetical protein
VHISSPAASQSDEGICRNLRKESVRAAFPVIAVALTVAFTVPRGQRRAVWAGVGFNPRRGRGLLIAVLGPAVIIAVSFGVAAAFGVVQFSGLPPGFRARKG